MNRRQFLAGSATVAGAPMAGCLSDRSSDGVLIDEVFVANFDSVAHTVTVRIEKSGERYSDETAEVSPIEDVTNDTDAFDIPLPDYHGDFSVEFTIGDERAWTDSLQLLDHVEGGRCVFVTCEFDPNDEVERVDEIGIHHRGFDCPE